MFDNEEQCRNSCTFPRSMAERKTLSQFAVEESAASVTAALQDRSLPMETIRRTLRGCPQTGCPQPHAYPCTQPRLVPLCSIWVQLSSVKSKGSFSFGNTSYSPSYNNHSLNLGFSVPGVHFQRPLTVGPHLLYTMYLHVLGP